MQRMAAPPQAQRLTAIFLSCEIQQIARRSRSPLLCFHVRSSGSPLHKCSGSPLLCFHVRYSGSPLHPRCMCVQYNAMCVQYNAMPCQAAAHFYNRTTSVSPDGSTLQALLGCSSVASHTACTPKLRQRLLCSVTACGYEG